MLKQNESELLSAYADNELNGDELNQVRESLASSAEWREELERIQKTKNLSMALPRMTAPADLLDFLEKEGEKASRRRFSFLNFGQMNMWAWGSTFATAALFLITIGVHRTHENGFIPLEPLLAAHCNHATGSLLNQNVVMASLQSSRIKNNVQK